jgi:hypothetical protein
MFSDSGRHHQHENTPKFANTIHQPAWRNFKRV